MRARLCRIDDLMSCVSSLLALAFMAPAAALLAQTSLTANPAPASSATEVHSAPVHVTQNSVHPISEEDIKQQLLGKTFYLRGAYLDNSLHFSESGRLTGNSPQASHTLSLIQITRVHLEKSKLELEGVRYGLHFLSSMPTEDRTEGVDRVRLSAKKKPVKIVIDREALVADKKQKESKADKKKSAQANNSGTTPRAAQPAAAAQTSAGQEKGRHGGTVTTSAEQANKTLRDAIDNIFVSDIDEKMTATLPDYWKPYYQAAAGKPVPRDASVFRQSEVDQKARLIAMVDPPSNEYAQANQVAGVAMYHVVVSPEGKPMEISVGRPIGFGLDENAVAAIRKATFQPAMKGGRPVPVTLDLLIQFRIYSKRTGAPAEKQTAAVDDVKADPVKPSLPGPYSAKQP